MNPFYIVKPDPRQFVSPHWLGNHALTFSLPIWRRFCRVQPSLRLLWAETCSPSYVSLNSAVGQVNDLRCTVPTFDHRMQQDDRVIDLIERMLSLHKQLDASSTPTDKTAM